MRSCSHPEQCLDDDGACTACAEVAHWQRKVEAIEAVLRDVRQTGAPVIVLERGVHTIEAPRTGDVLHVGMLAVEEGAEVRFAVPIDRVGCVFWDEG